MLISIGTLYAIALRYFMRSLENMMLVRKRIWRNMPRWKRITNAAFFSNVNISFSVNINVEFDINMEFKRIHHVNN